MWEILLPVFLNLQHWGTDMLMNENVNKSEYVAHVWVKGYLLKDTRILMKSPVEKKIQLHNETIKIFTLTANTNNNFIYFDYSTI